MTHYVIYFSEEKTESEPFIRLAAADYTGKNCDYAAILRAENGKPYFADPGMPHFSLSHSGKFIVCAVGPAPCGIDIQAHVFPGKSRDPAYLIRLAQRYFHPDETEQLKNTGDIREQFFHQWAAKESYVKFTGEGITGKFSSFSTLNPAGIFPARITKIPLEEGCSTFLCAEGYFEYTIKRI